MLEAGLSPCQGAEGKDARVLIPLKIDDARALLVEASPLLFGAVARQRISIRVNGELASVVDLQNHGDHSLEVQIPSSVVERFKGFRHLRLDFSSPGAACPKDIGLDDDSRQLALLLRCIMLR